MAVGRGDVWGIPDTETLERLKTIYPKLNQEEMAQDNEHIFSRDSSYCAVSYFGFKMTTLIKVN